jgi:Uma2 family endonuclease
MTKTLSRTPERESLPEDLPRFTRKQFHALLDAGILAPPQHYQLIEGIIYEKMPQNPPHRIGVILLQNWLGNLFGMLYVQGQATVEVKRALQKRNEPDPDIAVTREPTTAYRNRNPGPEDILLLAEVSETTLRRDLGVKALLYARSGIVEYWVLDLVNRCLIVHHEPGEEGYARIVEYGEGEEVATRTRPEAKVRVGELLPPVEEKG